MKTWQKVGLAGLAGAIILLLVLTIGGSSDERLVEVNTGSAVNSDTRPAERTSVKVDDADERIPDALLHRVIAAAVRAAGGGVATEVERSDDPGEAFEVEVVRGGVEVDVALDRQLRRIKNERFSD